MKLLMLVGAMLCLFSNARAINPPQGSAVVASSDLTGKRNFYFSSVSGDDSRSELQAQNPATPWKTLAKLNAYFANLQPGDAVAFKRGESFYGSIVVNRSGATNQPIIFTAYGSGNRPVINGLTTVSSWTLVGNNVYEAKLAGNSRVNMLTVNGSVKALGRYPNRGYLTMDSRSDMTAGPNYTYTGTLTDAESDAAVTNWKGAEIVIRKNEYTLDRCLITDHAGTTFYYNSPSAATPNQGYGYFIQNSPLTLDMQNEWYYDAATQRVRIYSTVNPSTLVIKAGTVETLVTIDNKTDLTFDNLGFEGADTAAFHIRNGSSQIAIQNCNFNYSGTEVVRGSSANHISFAGNTVNNTNSYALIMYGCPDVTVKNNTIKNTGMFAGMGLSNQQGYGAMFIQGENTLIEGNYVDSVGQSAIALNGGNNLVVKNNYITNFCRTISDGGGIYTNGNDGFTGKKLIGNIISNGYGNNEGTTSTVPSFSNGIYIDEGGSNVEILDNTVFNCTSSGIYIHQSHELIVKGNTLYGNSGNQISMVDDQPYADRIRNLNINNNILFASKPSQNVLYNASTSNDLEQFGSYDNNYYSRPFDVAGFIRTQYKVANGEVNTPYDLAAWSAKFNGRDSHSTLGAPIASYSLSNIEANKIGNGTFDNNVGGVLPDANTIITLDNKLDGNAAKFTAISPTTSDIGALINMGSTVAGKSYRIRFSLLGSTNTENLISYVRRFNHPDYSIVSESKRFPLRTTRTECEYLYTATVSEPDVKLTIIASGLLLPFWIDNVEVVAVDAVFNKIEDSVRFEYNNTSSVKSISLNGSYTDCKNNQYSNSVDLQPYTSIILLKSQSNGNQAPVARAGADIILSYPTTSASLKGNTSTDADGTIKAYSWTKISGPSEPTIVSSTLSITSIKNLVVGNYSFKLTVTDNAGAMSMDTVSVRVYAKSNATSTTSMNNSAATTTVMMEGGSSKETTAVNELSVYPNPAASVIATKFSSSYTGKVTVNIYNINGVAVQSAEFEKTGMLFEKEMNVSTLRAGAYYLQYKSNDGGTGVKQFIKH